MVPKSVDNLLLPVPVSGSHIGFSTLRMEPCWMAIGQAAGITASISIQDKVKVQNINIQKLQDYLIDQNATLIYYKDVNVSSEDFRMVQYMGLKGYLPDWEACLNEPIDKETFNAWMKLSGMNLDYTSEKITRKDILHKIYQYLRSNE